MVRFFKTHPYTGLEVELREGLRGMEGQLPEASNLKCLTLLGSAGQQAAWNDRRLSIKHKVAPLSGVNIKTQYPMFSQLIKQFGVALDVVLQPDPTLLLDLEQKMFNVFHVPEALGSPYVPAQTDFVIPFGIQSVLGFDGILLTGNLFTVILFSKVKTPRETTAYFKTLALNVKMAVLPFEDAAVFTPSPKLGPTPSDTARDAKQFTGFNDCQARCQESLDFHFNASLTVLNLAKVDAYLSFDYDADTPFSLATQKMVYFNEHLLEKVFSILDLDLSLIHCNPDLEALKTYGAIAPPGIY